jgi:hypothetical protein
MTQWGSVRWAGGSFQAAQRMVREAEDGTAFFNAHFAAKKRVAELHALADFGFLRPSLFSGDQEKVIGHCKCCGTSYTASTPGSGHGTCSEKRCQDKAFFERNGFYP